MDINSIEKRIKWEKFYDPGFDWNDENFYRNNELSEEFLEEFQDKIVWVWIFLFKQFNQTLSSQFQKKWVHKLAEQYKYQKYECYKNMKKI